MFFTKTFRHDTYPFISPSLVNMSGKTVLITGASRGIGFALAASYAKAGVSNIVLAARSSLEDTKAAVLKAAKVAGRPEPSLLLLKLDVSDPESVLETARQVQQKFSTVDVLVNNAGYMEPLGFVGDSNPENWWKAYEVNLRGPYLMIKAFLPIMVENEGDRQIVNVGSVGALWVIPSLSGYPTAKLALMRLTEVLDAEFASQGVLTFSLHPGGIRTDLALGLPEKLHQCELLPFCSSYPNHSLTI